MDFTEIKGSKISKRFYPSQIRIYKIDRWGQMIKSDQKIDEEE